MSIASDVRDDVNRQRINDHDDPRGVPQRDYSLTNRVYFKHLREHLIHHILGADLIVGCVAWLADPAIIAALSERKTMIVVQKEDFLRPDLVDSTENGWSLRSRYAALDSGPDRSAYDNLVGALSSMSDQSLAALRCCGMRRDPSQRVPTPTMHHKFVIFCTVTTSATTLQDDDGSEKRYAHEVVEPYAVWTGSFNFTASSAASFENAVYLIDQEIVNAYYHEWAQIVALSEPLDWQAEWIAPEWRIGT
jgi:hypothetical protein